MTLEEQIQQLEPFTVLELQKKYQAVFGESARSHNRLWLLKRIAWRIQARQEGDLSERARQRAAELANDADLRTTIPKMPLPETETKTKSVPLPTEGSMEPDRRLPVAGTILSRIYKGKTVHVRVLVEGFEWEGQKYRTLSAVAKAITGSHVNGFHFFKLNPPQKKA
jgi:hypothetical protein